MVNKEADKRRKETKERLRQREREFAERQQPPLIVPERVRTASVGGFVTAEVSKSVHTAQALNLENSIMPIWRADYFDKTRDQVPTRSVIIEAEYESDALDEARAGMGSPCCRAEVTRIDPNSSATIY